MKYHLLFALLILTQTTAHAFEAKGLDDQIEDECIGHLETSAHKDFLLRLRTPQLFEESNEPDNEALFVQHAILFEFLSGAAPSSSKAARHLIDLFLSPDAWMLLSDSDVRALTNSSPAFAKQLLKHAKREIEGFANTKERASFFKAIDSPKDSFFDRFFLRPMGLDRKSQEIKRLQDLPQNLGILFQMGIVQEYERNIILKALKKYCAYKSITVAVDVDFKYRWLPQAAFQAAQLEEVTARTLLARLKIEEFREVIRTYLEAEKVFLKTELELAIRHLFEKAPVSALSEEQAHEICSKSPLCKYWLEMAHFLAKGNGEFALELSQYEMSKELIKEIDIPDVPSDLMAGSPGILRSLEEMRTLKLLTEKQHDTLKLFAYRGGPLMDKSFQFVRFLKKDKRIPLAKTPNGSATILKEKISSMGYEAISSIDIKFMLYSARGKHGEQRASFFFLKPKPKRMEVVLSAKEKDWELKFRNGLLFFARHPDGDIFIFDLSTTDKDLNHFIERFHRLIPHSMDQAMIEHYEYDPTPHDERYELEVRHVDGRTLILDRKL